MLSGAEILVGYYSKKNKKKRKYWWVVLDFGCSLLLFFFFGVFVTECLMGYVCQGLLDGCLSALLCFGGFDCCSAFFFFLCISTSIRFLVSKKIMV